MSRDKLKQFYCLAHMHKVNEQRNSNWPLRENHETHLITNQLLLNSWMVCGLLNVYYYYTSLYAIVIDLFMLSHKPRLDQSPCTWYISWHLTSCGISCLIALHFSCYSTSREKLRFPQNFTHELVGPHLSEPLGPGVFTTLDFVEFKSSIIYMYLCNFYNEIQANNLSSA